MQLYDPPFIQQPCLRHIARCDKSDDSSLVMALGANTVATVASCVEAAWYFSRCFSMRNTSFWHQKRRSHCMNVRYCVSLSWQSCVGLNFVAFVRTISAPFCHESALIFMKNCADGISKNPAITRIYGVSWNHMEIWIRPRVLRRRVS